MTQPYGMQKDTSGDSDQLAMERIVERVIAAAGPIAASAVGRSWLAFQNVGAVATTYGFTAAVPGSLQPGEHRSYLAGSGVTLHKGAASTLAVWEGFRA